MRKSLAVLSISLFLLVLQFVLSPAVGENATNGFIRPSQIDVSQQQPILNQIPVQTPKDDPTLPVGEDPCEEAAGAGEKIMIIVDQQNFPDIQKEFDRYECYKVEYGVYRLDFDFSGKPLPITGVLSLGVKNKDHTVYINGLLIKKRIELFPAQLSSPLFTLSGEGRVILTDAKIDGVDKKNACLTVQTKGTVVSGGEYHNCTDGIRVEADGVRIEDSNVHSNNLGVHVANTVESRFVVGAAV